MDEILARHEAAFGDEHDEDCPLCGVDAEPRTVTFLLEMQTWVSALKAYVVTTGAFEMFIRESDIPLYTDRGGIFPEAGFIVIDALIGPED